MRLRRDGDALRKGGLVEDFEKILAMTSDPEMTLEADAWLHVD